jgi:glucose/arabinose dehydrogenase
LLTSCDLQERRRPGPADGPPAAASPSALALVLAGALLCACGGGGDEAAVGPPSSPSDAGTPATAAAARSGLPTGGTGSASAPDTTRPKVRLTSPENFASALIGTIVATATASDDVAVASVEFQVDGAPVGAPDTSSPFGVSVDTDLYPAGQHVIRARSRDTSGNVSGWSSATVQFSNSRTVPSGFTIEQAWLTGLSNATAFAALPGRRFLVALQGGTLRVVKAGALLPTPFVQLDVDSTGERGLLGVAPHPDFAANGFVYVYYTTGAGGVHNRVSRFTADPSAGGNVALAGSEVVLFDLPPLQATNHNGGAIHFGPDGKLYVGVGDNGRSETAQDLTQPFGKMLRFNDDGSIPSDNPFFASQTGLARSIWALGLRNPFTFAIRRGSGVMHINDVGQSTWEEINVGAPGANYGWPGSEGPDNLTAGITGPLFVYKHGAATPPGSGPGGFFVGRAIAGGAFYPAADKPGRFPATFRNNYYFADYVAAFVGRIDLARRNAAYSFAHLTGRPVDMIVGNDGALYVLTRNGVARIRSTAAAGPD